MRTAPVRRRRSRVDLGEWVEDALKRLGGRGSVVDVSREIWRQREPELRAAGDLFFTWQYGIRWAAHRLRRDGGLIPENKSPKGVWVLAPPKERLFPQADVLPPRASSLPGAGEDWTHDETVLAYALLVEGDHTPTRRAQLALARLIRRTEGAVRRKLGNLVSAESGGRDGLPHKSRVDDEVVALFRGRPEDLSRVARGVEARFARAVLT